MLVIARDARQQRATVFRYALNTLLQVLAMACMGLSLAAYLLPAGPVLPGPFVALPTLVICLNLVVILDMTRFALTHRKMAELRLIATPEGVSYTSGAGTYSAAWSQVQKVTVYTSGRFSPGVMVTVTKWGGPLPGYGRTSQLYLGLTSTGLTTEAVGYGMRYFSGGTVQPRYK